MSTVLKIKFPEKFEFLKKIVNDEDGIEIINKKYDMGEVVGISCKDIVGKNNNEKY